jgi:SP family general alpha glucoside:H+ symporter-like MFS transporter
MNEVIHNAKSATDKEHKMTLWQGIKLYPKAVGWSLLISTCIAMEGYDVCLLSNFCEYPYLFCFWGGRLGGGCGRKVRSGGAGMGDDQADL